MPDTPATLIRRTKVEEKTGLSRATIFRKIAEGTFPQPIRFSANLNLWVESEVDAWIASQVAKRDRGRLNEEAPHAIAP